MKKSLTVIFICFMMLLSGCSFGNSAKSLTVKGDEFLGKGDYETALDYYKKALDSGSTSDKVVALTEILDAYLEASEEYDEGDYDDAFEIIDELDYDYTGYVSIEDDMKTLAKDINSHLSDKRKIDSYLKKLSNCIDDIGYDESYIDEAYEIINELQGSNFDEEQAEEYEYQCQRLDKKISSTPKTPEKKEDEKPVNKPKEEPKKQETTTTENSGDEYYRVRKSWDDPSSQVGAFKDFENAVKAVKENPGYYAYNSKGEVVYPN